ncbi:MAG TPA: alkaline phosphatase family protein [Mycobacteriales bacterium]|jgi:phospholipase C|nr:alkaline phosphatase family protein [Mycobacteriales bacterium]
MSPITRRQLLLGTAAGAAGAAMGGALAAPAKRLITPTTLPSAADSGIEHIVFLCMENRSFDHYLGWLAEERPGVVTGQQAGLSYIDNNGTTQSTYHLDVRQGCGFDDPDHSYDGGRVQFNNGACDGFAKTTPDTFPLGYYTRADLPFYGGSQGKPGLVDVATTFDHWFCSILSSTYPNRYYTHAAQTERLDNTMATTVMPTIWDSLNTAGVSANYYFSDLPFLALWGDKYLPISRHMEDFFAQAASGTLPSFSYLDPFFLGEDQGGSNDDHPHADIWRGQAFVSLVAQAVVNSPLWPKTALVITYDEWGGFFDTVAPPKLPDVDPRDSDFDHSQAGFRVPAFVLSPYATRGGTANATFDHTSMLKFVEWQFGLPSLTHRDANAANIADVLDFANPNFAIPDLPVVADPGPHICGTTTEGGTAGMAAEDPFWVELRDYVRSSPTWRHVV